MTSPTSPNTFNNATDDINIKPTSSMLSPGASTRRTFFNRAFGKLEKGSLRGSTLSLISSAIGAGIFTLPYVFELVGWVFGIVLLMIGCFCGIWSALMLTWLATEHKLKSYDAIARKASPWASRFLGAAILVFGVGNCCSSQIILCTMMTYICNSAGVNPDFTSGMEFRAMVSIPVGYLVLFPLSA